MTTASKTKLTQMQKTTLSAARRARLEPKPSIGWLEHVVLGEAKSVTLSALERMGLIESYFAKDERIRYRLTDAGFGFVETA